MFDLHEELKEIVTRMNGEDAEYALCGGLAMAVYGLPRPNTNIDFLLPEESISAFRATAAAMGYSVEVDPVTFAGGAVVIRKFIKRETTSVGDSSLKALLVTLDLARVWDLRECIPWEDLRLCLVSRWGLIELKILRRSVQDLEDITRLRAAEAAPEDY